MYKLSKDTSQMSELQKSMAVMLNYDFISLFISCVQSWGIGLFFITHFGAMSTQHLKFQQSQQKENSSGGWMSLSQSAEDQAKKIESESQQVRLLFYSTGTVLRLIIGPIVDYCRRHYNLDTSFWITLSTVLSALKLTLKLTLIPNFLKKYQNFQIHYHFPLFQT